MDGRPPRGRTFFYVLQWLGYMFANVAVVPLILGPPLGLSAHQVAELSGRTFIIVGIVTLLQLRFGHRLPLMEAPGGIWWAVVIHMAAVASAPVPIVSLGPSLEVGLIVAGAVMIVLGLSGFLGRVMRLFTPAVTGTVLVLLALQLAGTFLQGMLGVTAQHPTPSGFAMAVSGLVLAIVAGFTVYGRGVWRSLGVLIALAAGWAISAALGQVHAVQVTQTVALPRLFAWGPPHFATGATLVTVVTGLVTLTNLVASVFALAKVIGRPAAARTYDRGAVWTGFANMLAGVGAAIGYVPYTSSAGLVAMSGVAARRPLAWAAAIFGLLGFVPLVGAAFASIPPAVGYAVTTASFAQILCFGLRDYHRLRFDMRDIFVVGLALMVGAGTMSLAPASLAHVPAAVRELAGNGLIVGLVLALFLEHVVFPHRDILNEE